MADADGPKTFMLAVAMLNSDTIHFRNWTVPEEDAEAFVRLMTEHYGEPGESVGDASVLADAKGLVMLTPEVPRDVP